MFSQRSSHFEGLPNRIYRQKAAIIREGKPLIDLISANVHYHDIQYPQAILKKAFQNAAEQASIYQPNSAGQLTARMAIQKYYAHEGVDLSSDQIILTPGTSVAYQYLFHLFANAGEEILSYPFLSAL
jgi:aspartate/methionine/tyrosine aminotransferase